MRRSIKPVADIRIAQRPVMHLDKLRRRPVKIGALIPAVICALSRLAGAETVPPTGLVDTRIRVVTYNRDEVYRLQGFVGYQIDLQFAADERFVGLGAGDLDAVAFAASANHLFIKPKAAQVSTNLTVLTTRHFYHFDYTVTPRRAESSVGNVIYSLRFEYPSTRLSDPGEAGLPKENFGPDESRTINSDYWYCGSPSIRPSLVSDDGIHTRLRFGARMEQPAIFVRNDDGSESLLNFSMETGDVVLHRVVRQLIVRRGRLVGTIFNKAFSGSGERLESGTVSRSVLRATEASQP